MTLIGVSPGFMYPDNSRRYFASKNLAFIENDMACFLAQQNIIPVLIPDLPPQKLHPLLEKCAGFVLQGGSDIAPQTYGATPLNAERWPGDPVRDAFEFKLIEFAVQRKKPLLGICRGFQLINVFFGGSLYQDLALEFDKSIEHRNIALYDQLFHTVEIVPGGYLADIYLEKMITVNSLHHQGVKNLASNLRVESVANEDGLIEAISSNGDHFILGVQWHPEFSHTLQQTVADPQKIMDLFISMVRKHENY